MTAIATASARGGPRLPGDLGRGTAAVPPAVRARLTASRAG